MFLKTFVIKTDTIKMFFLCFTVLFITITLMASCNTTVTTPTGVFTYFLKKMTVCEAKAECAKIQKGFSTSLKLLRP